MRNVTRLQKSTFSAFVEEERQQELQSGLQPAVLQPSLLNDHFDPGILIITWQMGPRKTIPFRRNKCYNSYLSSSALSGTGSRGQQSQQRHLDVPLPRHLFQLLWGEPKMFPGQPRDIVPL
ncbi:hypothetical protein XENOCAPTIV_028405, partial [Xenoophorus captivus]